MVHYRKAGSAILAWHLIGCCISRTFCLKVATVREMSVCERRTPWSPDLERDRSVPTGSSHGEEGMETPTPGEVGLLGPQNWWREMNSLSPGLCRAGPGARGADWRPRV